MLGRKIFLTGGTGYLGSRLIPLLLVRGHEVTALARPGSEAKLSGSVRIVAGNALDSESLRESLSDCETWVQLIGTPHPAPWKARQFRAVDYRAVSASVQALKNSRIRHYVYLSVAQPAPVMRAYVQVRQEAETLLRQTDTPVTFIRPWYVIGPGHRWPLLLTPIYRILERIPATREGALRFGLVTVDQMLAAMVKTIEKPPASIQILDVPAIRLARL
ncbi:MAG: NAD-dependent epimerase/dehydratase [Fibrobacteres bacterium]|nr:NAD-dependent epimerase/dehydratase [Fibrobacterota bacterium]